MITVLLLAAQVIAADDLAPRMAALQKFWERLDAIAVTKDFETEKASGLAAAKKRLDAGVTSVDEYNALYRALDDLRTSLLAHAAEKPSRAEGSFADEADAWMVKTPLLELRLKKSDLSPKGPTYSTLKEFCPGQ